MKKSLFLFIGCLSLFAMPFVSCGETDTEADLYADWENRNQHYIDSIAVVARANTGTEPGQWKVIHSYKFSPPLSGTFNANDYVYCRILENGEGATPLFTDTAAVSYRGQLIPLSNGTVVTFEETYSGELNKETSSPSKHAVSGSVTGFATALMHMKAGDRWVVYIPYSLGYGSAGKNTIKGYSTLIFDLYLDDVYPLKGKK
ncbi:FKBP-type peptidyl-prolyl cis-trans isomerase [Phocaeicola abscessus]|uniref:FKBP-type peptidyl-prolyl cis-trans isomerase n=1 Tax=Phocaeicola abscessus TaxID=555313 RepID=UPI0028EDB112|nr:FKBP-type peptidyl-prolyl cis-trans isomerase [Phocaeicola abscessus]